MSDSKGILFEKCIFCSDAKKRLKGHSTSGSFEKLCKIETVACQSEIISAAKRFPELNKYHRVLSLASDDLIAMEAKYHNTCKRKFLREIEKQLSEVSKPEENKSVRKSMKWPLAIWFCLLNMKPLK